ncbi:VWA domain-containing protein [bacterium]|nr:VWA domain-containing protein [bacterium]
MSAFRFAEPQWVHALWAVLVFVVLLFWLDRRRGSALDRLLGRRLQERLVHRPAPWRRLARVLLLGLSAAALVLALMRPQWGMRYVATPRVGAEIMIGLDVSRSMLAEDVAPNRLERAKAEIADLLTYLDGDHVGLIAFAGRASVLAPLTPDFSFLRLVLDGTGPHSVTRGGTRIEEPIRKAVAGFGPTTGASRALLLITDGEDHGSFPLDAAKAAAEAGVKIIAIGFGDEGGGEIYVTDPRTGARTLLRDAEGRAVVSRLDGELLRDLALETGGAYVPAGTGLLDLQSIYEEHIARLTRGQLDPRGRAVREEGYQWFVLLSLVALLASAAIASGRAGSVASPGRAARAAAAALLALALAAPGQTRAQESPESRDEPAARATPDRDTAASEDATEPETPRKTYNHGVAALENGDVAEADQRLASARREARDDGELRFRASYNLGWSAVRRAEGLENESPEEALQALYQAADWFRDAVAQRPGEEGSRHNLDVTLRRALVLSDGLSRENERGIDERLEELATRERALVGEVAQLHQVLAEESDPNATDRFRREFRGHASAQRTILSDADALAVAVGDERDAIEMRAEEERTPEDAMRATQLDGVLHHLHRAREKMGQTRQQLRRRQSERAYRRASAALSDLKRAADQLRDPVAVLERVLSDAGELAFSTGVLALSRGGIPGLDQPLEVPAWLTLESLRELQDAIAERTGELHRRLLSGLERAADAPEQQLLAAVSEAEPFVAQGHDRFQQSLKALGADAPDRALVEQREAIAALAEVRERFLDLRGLIEVTYADEKQIEALLGAESREAEIARGEMLASLRGAQEKNLGRAERLQDRLLARLEALAQEPPAQDPTGHVPDDEGRDAEEKRLEVAGQLLTLVLAGMDDAAEALGEAEADLARVDWTGAREAAARANRHLEALRRLFFSTGELVRELAERQLDLADKTQDALALAADSADEAAARAAALVPRQTQLAERAGAIANALAEQSNQAGGVVAAEADHTETSRRLREAGEHVLFAETEMRGAAEKIEAVPPEFEAGRAHQDAALAELGQALELLTPPQQQQRQGEGPQQQPQSSGDGEHQDEPRQSAATPTDPAQLLQAVRDREAQRRRAREKSARSGYETVEKDW